MRKIIDIKEASDVNKQSQIQILCTVPELFNDDDFEKIEKIKEAKQIFNERNGIIYFMKAEDLLKIKEN